MRAVDTPSVSVHLRLTRFTLQPKRSLRLWLLQPALLCLAAGSLAFAQTGTDVTTYHNDTMRTGLNSHETVLTPANVSAATFGKTGQEVLDGRVDAEPLYLSQVSANGFTANVLYVATEHGSLYAIDADWGNIYWKTSMLGAQETTSDDHGCGQITPEIGITDTPVIDRQKGPHGTIYLVAMSKDSSGKYHQRLHAIDAALGTEMPGSPVEIAASYAGTGAGSSGGQVVFDSGQYAERSGLLLSNGSLYLAWTSHCDIAPYTGWVMAYNEATLKQTSAINLTPNGSDGSIWMAGNGLTADTAGNVYFLDANGTFDTTMSSTGFPSKNDFGNGFIKLTNNGSLQVADYFEPSNTVSESNVDQDIGSGGGVLLPDMTDTSGNVHHLMVGAGKDHNIYVVNRDNMGKFSASANNIYQQLSNALPSGAWSSPAYFNNTIYYAGVGDALKAFHIANAQLTATPSSVSANSFPYPGATPSITSNGTQNGIVWVLESGTDADAVLHAYDASDLSHELYNSTQASNGRDSFGTGNKFITPLVVNGKVYVGTPNGVAGFQLLSH